MLDVLGIPSEIHDTHFWADELWIDAGERSSLVHLAFQSPDRETVDRECGYPLAVGPVYGCQSASAIALPDGRTARLIKVVRYTDALPSPMAFEIEIHELCHTVAALQTIDDPCHAENNGLIQMSRRR